ncbi:coiled-coil domain-containing protein 22 homolog [Phoenix dactylifera]|uniref:Coiled-coil domain-containing protein 22 homolog n=1 Tax=Phoenix dactylifera TaxID=42345 RepID=A0A8B8ZZ47_PHODC|nr:coiled-coil domain-containing protein 22 homolog [Phoenix dactylifera]XP_038976818.1 coiled-coil domain-containing protein 22 homolog [Phoenix dactylifera]
MDEAQEILLSSLSSSGVSLPAGVSSIKDLGPDALVSICSQSLRLLDDDESSPSFSTSLPEPTAERFKICTDVASAVKSLGYRGDLSFHQFLYPSYDDSYKLVRFLVERLSGSSEGRRARENTATKSTLSSGEITGDIHNDTLEKLKEKEDKVRESQSKENFHCERRSLGESTKGIAEPSETVAEEVYSDVLLDTNAVPGQSGVSAETGTLYSERIESSEIKSHCSKEGVEDAPEKSMNSEKELCVDGEDMTQTDKYIAELERKLASLQEQLSKLRNQADSLKNQEDMMTEAKQVKALKVQSLESEHELLKAAMDMALDEQHSVGFYIEMLNGRVEAKRQSLMKLESQWNDLKQTVEQRQMREEQSLYAEKSSVQEKLIKLKEIEQETDATVSDICKREDEHAKLLLELEKLPKISSRKSYIQRITEITKNSWKQDADVERIIKETRELQLESNSIQERLHRTYAVVEETVFRNAKDDPVRLQVYRLLTSIHDSFEQISDKLLAADRARREATEQEAKLTAISSRSFDISKLQADLDSIRKENEFLEQQLCHE